MNKICSIIGARPQFIKACPLSRELRKYTNEVLIHTGQHYDSCMSDIFFSEMDLPEPDYYLKIGSGSHGKQTGQMIGAIEDVLLNEKPDAVIIYGDTNSTLAGALTAVKLHIPIAHIEAGLRSFNNLMPEEINRIVADKLSSWLFIPSETAKCNLAAEGIHRNVYNVGDIMLDAIQLFQKFAHINSPELNDKLNGTPFYLSTIHRAENTDNEERLKKIFSVFSNLNEKIILPLHPRTNERIKKFGIKPSENVRIIDPVGYLEMISLMQRTDAILTDSGGIQKEAYYLNVPCITLRDETEWVETVQSGWNILTGINESKILSAIKNIDKIKLLPHPEFYGDGNTAEKIIRILLDKI